MNILSGSYHLLFLEDPLWQDLKTAAADNHLFELLITSDGIHYMKYNVVFTTLPVLCMEGKEYAREEARIIYAGNFCLQTPPSQSENAPIIQESQCQWHIRGVTSSTLPHKPYKISLKRGSGQNNHLELLGLGADDDWILNSMNVDSLSIREKLFMDLWNENAKTCTFHYPMSTGQYVEAVINQEYCGLYYLQRRVDAKYLNINKQDILLKGNSSWVPATVEEAYRIISSPYSDEQTYSIVKDLCTGTLFHGVDPDNFIDVNLFLQFFTASDNIGYKNMYYLIHDDDGEYTVTFIPWDTDMSLGIIWTTDFALDYPFSLSWNLMRKETHLVKEKCPQYDEKIGLRWHELRNTVFREDHILEIIDNAEAYLTQSGALLRNNEKWGKYFSSDSMDSLRQYIPERLAWLDNLYRP